MPTILTKSQAKPQAVTSVPVTSARLSDEENNGSRVIEEALAVEQHGETFRNSEGSENRDDGNGIGGGDKRRENESVFAR